MAGPIDVQLCRRGNRQHRLPADSGPGRVVATEDQPVPGSDHVLATEAAGQDLLGALVAVDQHDGPRIEGLDEGDHLHAVGVGGKAVGAEPTGNWQDRPAQSQLPGALGPGQVQEGPAGGLLVLVAGQEDGILRVPDERLGVAKRRPTRQHPAGGDDDARAGRQGPLPLLGGCDRLDRVGVERVGGPPDLVGQLPRYVGLVPAIDAAHRPDHPVHEHRHRGQRAVSLGTLQNQQDLLGSADGEGRDQHPAALGDDLADLRQQPLLGGVAVLMQPLAVSGLTDRPGNRAGRGRARSAGRRRCSRP